jgi:hypothetical protein
MPDPLVKRVAGVLYPGECAFNGGAPDEDPGERWFEWTFEKLGKLWGAPELVSSPVPFTLTDYYRDIAPRLLRRFIAFEGLVPAGGLAGWKLASIAVEAESRTPRIVNIDPGYVDGARLVLASTKDHAHRVYLRDGIHAEVTLRFRFGKWTPFDYTFPDFASGVYNEFLSKARASWLKNAGRKLRRP